MKDASDFLSFRPVKTVKCLTNLTPVKSFKENYKILIEILNKQIKHCDDPINKYSLPCTAELFFCSEVKAYVEFLCLILIGVFM